MIQAAVVDETRLPLRVPTWQEIEQALGQFAGPRGVEIPGEFLIGVGTA